MKFIKTGMKVFVAKLSLLALILMLSSCTFFERENYRFVGDSLIIDQERGEIALTALEEGVIEVVYKQKGVNQLPSFSKKENIQVKKGKLTADESNISFSNGGLKAVINKENYQISFYRGNELLTTQTRFFNKEKQLGFDFKLDPNEKIMGGGQRVLGMDRRGHKIPLYNRAHYGYTTESNQMNYSLPLVISSNKYSILFDNSAKGFLDIGKTNSDILSFEAVGGQSAYIVFAGDSYPELLNDYVDVTGKQPMPPRWALGNISSRFGYRSQQEVLDTIDKFIEEDMPVDSIIIDLYWFGNDIKGFMGNLDWDKETFPSPNKMIDELTDKGIKTILITEPFILSSSDRWQEAVNADILAKDEKGDVKRFDFYFGNTGLIDVFDQKGIDWFSHIYSDLIDQGISGVWGDLGEPEVHPDDTLHYLSATQQSARGDEIHNAYGHQWVKMVYENQIKKLPNERPFILMRSGFAGSQRYGILPWTGDVSRSWDGLKPQVELSLQMGLGGLAYTHSDLGGFAGGEVFDKEMYIRWLQYGVFQPIYRPHAQDNIAPEPVFHDQETKDIIRDYIKLRYQLLPYNYTLAYQNSTTGMPLMRPIFFEDENDKNLIDIKDTYLWGDSFLVSPIVEPNQAIHKISLPKGVWFDFWNDTRYQGGKDIEYPLDIKRLPVLVRAGAFIPMVDPINNTKDYSSQNLTLHYYSDEKVTNSEGFMYEDDGISLDSIDSNSFEKLSFKSHHDLQKIIFSFERTGNGYPSMPNERNIKLVIHNWGKEIDNVKFGSEFIEPSRISYNQENNQLIISLKWQHQSKQLVIVGKE